MYECMKMYEEKIEHGKKKVLYGMEKNLHTFSYIHTLFNNNLSLKHVFFHFTMNEEMYEEFFIQPNMMLLNILDMF